MIDEILTMLLAYLLLVPFYGLIGEFVEFIDDRIWDWKFKRRAKLIKEYFTLRERLDNQLVNNGLKDYDPNITIYSDGFININEVKRYIKNAKRKRLCR